MNFVESLFIVAIVIVLGFVGFCFTTEVKWYRAPIIEKTCHLSSQNFTASTLRTNVVPLFTGKNMGMAVTTSGNPETNVTIWNCGDFGTIQTDDKDIFRWAKEESILLMKVRGKDYRVEGIKH